MNLNGTWNLEVATPFGKHPATLVLEEAAGGAHAGRIDSRLGNAPLRDLSASGDAFDATVSLEFQGRAYEASISGQTDGDEMSGTIKVRLAIAPTIRFTGTRAG